MGRTLALDLGKTTGYAFSLSDSGVWDFREEAAESFGYFWQYFHVWLEEKVKDKEVTTIIYESCIHQKGNAARIINSLVCLVEMVGYRHGIEVRTCHQMTLKKHATGSGRTPKGKAKWMMKMAARKKWPKKKFVDDNHIDALWLLDYARCNPAAVN